MGDSQSRYEHLLRQPVAGVLLLAGAYFATGKLGLLLAIPPGHATSIWPPAGIALAMVLLRGYRIWPGVFLGSFPINLEIALDAVPDAAIVSTVAKAASIGVGASLQAVAGAYLIRRFVGIDEPLYGARRVLAFLLLGGPVACLINATWAVGTLELTGSLVEKDFGLQWLTWWVGDGIGVAICAPILLVWAAEPAARYLPRRLPVTVPLALGLAITVFLFLKASRWQEERMRLEFESLVEAAQHDLEKCFEAGLAAMRSIGAARRSYGPFDEETFRAIASPHLSANENIFSLSWNPLVRGDARADFERGRRAAGHGGFEFREKRGDEVVRVQEREEHVIVEYIEPLGPNAGAVGFDLASEAKRRRAIERARRTGRPAATEAIQLVQENGRKQGILLMLPVWEEDTGEPVSATPRSLLGFATGVFRIDGTVRQAFSAKALERMDIEIVDGGGEVLFHHRADNPPRQAAWLEQERERQVADHTWQVRYAPNAASMHELEPWTSALVLSGGALFCSMLGAFLLVITGRIARIELLVRERGRMEAKLQASVQEKEVLLAEVHHRVKNNLQVILSLLRLQSRQTRDTGAAEVLRQSGNRVRSISLLHERLLFESEVPGIDFGGFLKVFVADLFRSYGVGPEQIAYEVDAVEVPLGLRPSVPCGLIVNELVSNSIKHGFPDGGRGRVRVHFSTEGGGRFLLVVSDDGVGTPAGVKPGPGGSLGLTLVEEMVAQLGGGITRGSGPGTETRIEFTVAEAMVEEIVG